KSETRHTITDSLVRNNGSTQSLGSLPSQTQQQQQEEEEEEEKEQEQGKEAKPSTPSPPASPRSEKSSSDLSIGRTSLSAEQEASQEQFSPNGSLTEADSHPNPDPGSASDSEPAQDDILSVNVVRHERSRTLPGILDGSILWSLTRALSSKKPAPPPLESDSSDSDSDDFHEAADGNDDILDDSDKESDDSDEVESTSGSISQSGSTLDHSEDVQGKIQPAELSVPARAAISNRAQVPRERVVIAEAQVQIGDDLEDDNPFTDSHALPALSPAMGTATAPKGQHMVTNSSPGSSPSPSLSPLSYLTGSSASGSTWSLQGSRQSLMKMIFKSKNEPTPTSSTEMNINTDLNVEPVQRKRASSFGSVSPLTPLQSPQTDIFAGFESTGAIETVLDIQTKDPKLRSYIIP
ncbi:hypothetical protein BGX34_006687, partial [Mortierella sp. NVP85]